MEIGGEQLSQSMTFADELSKDLKVTTRIVGWYHSHPRITVSPSHVDLRTQHDFQLMDSGFFGLIFSLFTKSATDAGRVQMIGKKNTHNLDQRVQQPFFVFPYLLHHYLEFVTFIWVSFFLRSLCCLHMLYDIYLLVGFQSIDMHLDREKKALSADKLEAAELAGQRHFCWDVPVRIVSTPVLCREKDQYLSMYSANTITLLSVQKILLQEETEVYDSCCKPAISSSSSSSSASALIKKSATYASSLHPLESIHHAQVFTKVCDCVHIFIVLRIILCRYIHVVPTLCLY